MIALLRAAGRLLVDVTSHEACPGPVPIGQLEPDIFGFAGTQRIQADLPAATVRLWRAVAAAFPNAKGLGAWGDRAHAARKSCHNLGKAVDVMTTDPAVHAAVVKWALDHRTQFGITLVISRRQKWSAATGWKPAKYKGTSPHTDHVHFSVQC